MNKIKNFIKENIVELIIIASIAFLFNFELPYVIYTPGGAINMSERISGDNTYDEEGSLNMTYVSVINGTIPFLLLAKVIQNWEIVPEEDLTYDGEDYDTSVLINKLELQNAISTAEYVAYNASNTDYTITVTEHYVVYISSDAVCDLEIGDIILKIDDTDLSSYKSITEYDLNKEIGDEVTITYLRDDKEYTGKATLIDIDGEAKIGISVLGISDYDTEYNIEVSTKSSESGPSGGLITALAIYNQITETDITSGKTIMGTGTISLDGTVGEIGGVKYKVLGAIKNDADLFICPIENYEEALSVAKDADSDLTVVGVSTFSEALDYLLAN